MVDIEDRAVGEELGRDRLIGLLALGRNALGARFGMGGIDVLVAVLAVVLRRVAGLEDEGIAVGIAAAAPADQVELKLAILGLL